MRNSHILGLVVTVLVLAGLTLAYFIGATIILPPGT